MKKLLLALLFIPSFLSAFTLNVVTKVNETITTESFQLSGDESTTFDIGKYKTIMSVSEEGDHALLTFSEQDEEMCSTTQLVVNWNEVILWGKYPQKDVDAILLLMVTK